MSSLIPIRENEMRRYFLSYDNVDGNNNSGDMDYYSLCPNCVVRQNVVPYRTARPPSSSIIELLGFCRRSHRNMARLKGSDTNTETAMCLKDGIDDSVKEKTNSESDTVSRPSSNHRELIERRCDVEQQMKGLKISGE